MRSSSGGQRAAAAPRRAVARRQVPCPALAGLGGLALPMAAHAEDVPPFSMLAPAGRAAAEIATVWWAMLGGAVFAMVLTLALAAIALLRHRRSPGGDLGRDPRRDLDPRTIQGDHRRAVRWLLWGGGIALPGVAIVALLLYGLNAGRGILSTAGDAPFRVQVTAQQWRWTAQYPDGEPGVAPGDNRVLIPVGRPVDVSVVSADVIHSFWIPRLGGKVDAIPGHVNTIRLQADRPGVYRGLCAEFCGTLHASMHMEIEALDDAAFAARFPAAVASMQGAAR